MTREEAIEELKDIRNEWSRHIYPEGVRKQISLDMAIKSLKQEPCEDAVSRTEITDELNRLGRNAFKDDTDYDNFFAFLDSLPPVTPTPKWIPCSEKLPEENEDVLIDIKEGEEHTFFVTRLVDVTYWVHLGRDVNVEAWMPLPEPYKAEMEGENEDA